MSSPPQDLSGLTPAQKRALLERLLQERKQKAASLPPVGVSPRVGPIPLSNTQLRASLLERLSPGTPSFNLGHFFELRGTLDPIRLEDALRVLGERHEILRTLLVPDGPQLRQEILPAGKAPFRFRDLSTLPPAEREQALAAEIHTERTAGFALATGPLFRATLLRSSAEHHLLFLTAHSTVLDGASLGLLLAELGELYAAALEGRAPRLADVPLQFADWAQWEQAHLAGAWLGTRLDGWEKRLSPLPEPVDLPLRRTSLGAPLKGHLDFALPQPIARGITALSREWNASPFMILGAAFQAFLFHHAGATDVLVGTTTSGRTQPGTEQIVGPFNNTVPLRLQVDPQQTVREVVERFRKTTLEALASEVPFQKLVERVRPARQTAGVPLLPLLFQVRSMGDLRLRLGGVEAPIQVIEEGELQFELILTLLEDAPDGTMPGALFFRRDLFDAQDAARMAEQFCALVAALVERPAAQIGQLSLLSAAERTRLLDASHHPREVLGEPQLLHRLFERQAAATPDRVALVQGEATLRFDALERRANQLAHHLRSLGVGPEVLVGVCLERGPDLLCALLAILKAGGAYLPLDPEYPEQRLAYMLGDSGARVLLTTSSLARALPTTAAEEVLLDGLALEGLPASAPPAPSMDPAQLAYVLYTSGSTGNPKGVMIPHGSVVNFLASMAREPGLAAEDTLLAVTSVSFDIAALELFLPLAVGARLVLADREAAKDPRALAALLEASGATVLQCTPSVWGALMETGYASPRLRAFCGGEALTLRLAETLTQRVGRVHNLYGPTETTIWSSHQRVDASHLGRARSPVVAIGGPILNTSLYVLDALLQPVPAGVAGELYIGGLGVARGYHGRPELTAERFVPDSLAPELGARMYRTGDRARWREDGTLEFLGRLDFQVKLRGHRIELGEIEDALSRVPELQDVAVTLQGTGTDARLVAWYVPRPDASPSASELRERLRHSLPEIMVPAAFVALPALPLTANRKLDRKALTALGATAGREGTAYAPPTTPLEQLLVELWSTLLDVPRVGVHDDFFELGGHSLLLPSLGFRLHERLGIELPLDALFRAPTVAQLARRIEAQRGAGEASA